MLPYLALNRAGGKYQSRQITCGVPPHSGGAAESSCGADCPATAATIWRLVGRTSQPLSGRRNWRPMSAMGQERTFNSVRAMSALPPKADMDHDGRHVRFVPKADILHRSNLRRYSITSSARI